MKCPECGGKTQTFDTYHWKEFTRRRRECLVCGQRFSTIEMQIADGIHSKRIAAMIAKRKSLLGAIGESFQDLLEELERIGYTP